MNLLKTLAAISSMTMLSRITGLLRESLMARAFGSGVFMDAFIVAFRLPNLLRRLFAEGAFSQAFVPLLSEYKTKNGEADTKNLVDQAATFLVWATVLISVLGIVGAPLLISLITDPDSQTPESRDATIWMTRFMFPYIVCMSFVAMAGGILNTWRQFKIPAFTPVLLNLSSIFGSLVLYKYTSLPIYGLAVAVMLGGLLQVGLQIPALLKIGMLPRLSMNPLRALRDVGVRRILKQMVPALMGVGAAQVSLLINTAIASSLGPGSVSSLNWADRLMEFPTAMLGVALGTILMPGLAKANAGGDSEEYSGLLNWGLRLTFLLALPSAVGLAILATPVLATVLNYGNFSAAATEAASAPLIAYCVSLIGIIAVKTLTPAFFARQDFQTPLRIAIGVVVAVQLMNLVFVPALGVAGLALSIGVGACINALCLYVLLRKRGIFKPQPGWIMFFIKLALAVTVMGAIGWYASAQYVWTGPQVNGWLRAGLLTAIISTCMVAYFGVLGVLGFRVRDFKRTGR
ncbi:murein biosynthesis integral membrane protein MurJ [Massilia sp. PAMC28688]|uniref:murein biosynthesis integral membrane protein MurJ n=1 Tax=Massilia sp. PAMC28688 TaxID=2861283 RepID=UPI001C62E87E|nr:murein biosynthesis integral membrane protein MurJ [Massilia sp. PAMC28688]QYF93991.1 murein biosynthesis integral membrane protein MurJ [Massilia sp. PAMC28688]